MHFMYKKFNALMLLFLLCACCASIKAQEKRYSERYADTYKNYLYAACPIKKDSIQHFVYFARDRELALHVPYTTWSIQPAPTLKK